MGVWSTSTPAGSDLVSQGDDRLRELKSALAEALSHEDSTFPGATPGSTPIFIPGFLRGATGSRPTGDSLVSGRLYINTTLGIIERYNGASWDTVANYFAAGTKMVFYQASAPTGWTAEAVNDKFLRVVTAGGTGGTNGGTVAASTSLAHSHTALSDGEHDHVYNAYVYDGSSHGALKTTGLGVTNFPGAAGSDIYPFSGTATLDANGANVFARNTATDGAHTHTTDSQFAGAFAYSDVIIATKD